MQIKFRHNRDFLTFDVPDNAVQLVGYDSHGAEVYDRDELIMTDEDGRIVAMEPFHLQFLDQFAECLPPNCKLILWRKIEDD